MALTDTVPTSPWVPEESFGHRLIQARKHLGLTQLEAAAMCDLDDGSWSNWENGARPRGLDVVVRKVVAGLNVDRDWLMWGAHADETCAQCGAPRMTCFCAKPQVTCGRRLFDPDNIDRIEQYANVATLTKSDGTR